MNNVLVVMILLVSIDFSNSWGKDFKSAMPGYTFNFPADHGSHEDYQIEWWYFTGHLIDKRGDRSGYELTFFRTGIQSDSIRENPSRWHVRNIYSAHFAISNDSVKQFWFNEKMSREGLGKGGAASDHFQVWIDQWSGIEKKGIFYLSASDFNGKNEKAIELQLSPVKPAVIHGLNGASPKDKEARNQSHYYSLTRLKTKGKITWNNETREVEGLSWMDHEFGSAPLLPSQTGWDWFSIQLENQTELMLYQIRNRETMIPFSFGTLIDEKGVAKSLQQSDFILKPISTWKAPEGQLYPTDWEINIPSQNISLIVTPSFQNQELSVFGGKFKYWEGSMIVKGVPSSGYGYLELTGYANDFTNLFSQYGQ